MTAENNEDESVATPTGQEPTPKKKGRSGDPSKTKTPLVFDLDGTLIVGDCLWEAVVHAACTKPWILLGTALAFLNHGRSRAKTHLAERCPVGPRNIAPNTATIAHLTKELEAGRTCLMATASPMKWAKEINDSLGSPFDEIFATLPSGENLKGPTKARVLEDRFGKKGFDYVGDSISDIPVWKAARQAILAGGSKKTAVAAKKAGIEAQEIEPRRQRGRWSELLRTHQWSKNLLVLIPLVAAHKYGELDTIIAGLVTLAAFCATASGNYILNDLWDAPRDRGHPDKCSRPLAAGEIGVPTALGTAALLVVGGLSLGATVSPATAGALAIYMALAFGYSHWAKSVMILDALVLASLYCIRLWTGGTATETPVSFWLMSASLFLFFSLALGKRDAELSAHQKTNGRGYKHGDRTNIAAIGAASAVGSAFMLCLYIQSPEAQTYYAHNPLLWALPSGCIYWAGRFWLLCGRGQMTEDPVIWAIKDKPTWLCAGAVTLALTAAHAWANVG